MEFQDPCLISAGHHRQIGYKELILVGGFDHDLAIVHPTNGMMICISEGLKLTNVRVDVVKLVVNHPQWLTRNRLYKACRNCRFIIGFTTWLYRSPIKMSGDHKILEGHMNPYGRHNASNFQGPSRNRSNTKPWLSGWYSMTVQVVWNCSSQNAPQLVAHFVA